MYYTMLVTFEGNQTFQIVKKKANILNKYITKSK